MFKSDPDFSKKAIILGGHGFLGTSLSAEAEKCGWETIRIGRADYKKHIGTTCGLLINADGNSKKYLAEKDRQLDFDLSVRSVSASFRDFRANLYVYLSSIDVYPDKSKPANNSEEAIIDPALLSCYGFHKLLAENIVRHHARKWLIFRMGGFVGAGLKKNSIYDMLKREKLRVHPDSRYQYLDAGVMAEIVFKMIGMGQANTIFNLTGEGAVTLREIAELIPEQPLAGAPLDKQPEHYEINVSKVKKITSIPSTHETVERFVKKVLAGAISLS